MSKKTKKVSPAAILEVVPFALTLKQAAQYSSMTLWALRTAVWSGKLSARLSGKRLLILRSDLENFVTNSLDEVRSGKVVNTPQRTRKKMAA